MPTDAVQLRRAGPVHMSAAQDMGLLPKKCQIYSATKQQAEVHQAVTETPQSIL